MDGLQKLFDMQQYMKFEVDEDPAFSVSPAPACPQTANRQNKYPASAADLPIEMAVLPNGQRIPLLKTMLTSACERHCYYCAFRSGRDFSRQSFSPDELAKTCFQLYKSGVVKGIFLSSGVAGGGMFTQDRLIATAEVLRQKLNFQGYLHLKIMPGADHDQVERAMQLADRVSVNLEAPTTERLSKLSPEKNFMEELLKPLRWVQEIRQNQPAWKGWKGKWSSSTTQFVAGGSGETDLELLQTTAYLHQKYHLSRVYYSGFHPVEDTPLENQPAINPWRQNRLYQASFLLRDYGFEWEELPFTASGDLPLEMDPKLALAEATLRQAPIEVNRADYNQLLRIPGIGPVGARRIIAARRQNHIRQLDDLKAAGVRPERAAPFILLDGFRPSVQLRLW